MAGTDKNQSNLSLMPRDGLAPRPVVVLVEPQMGENIGAAARAMYNFGLLQLRLVNPRDGWPNPKAVASASGAVEVIDRVRVFGDFREAVSDLGTLYATTARPREMVKPVLAPAEAARDIASAAPDSLQSGIIFGGERAGLSNEHISLADKIVTIPVNPSFSSLNLAQSVLLLAYEWSRTWVDTQPGPPHEEGRLAPAARADVYRFFEHLEAELTRTGFLYPPEKAPTMVRNIRSLFLRAGLSDQDVRTLRGIVKSLARGRPGAQTEEGHD